MTSTVVRLPKSFVSMDRRYTMGDIVVVLHMVRLERDGASSVIVIHKGSVVHVGLYESEIKRAL